MRPPSDPASDPTMAVNLSVWESVEALERFVWATVHKQFYNRKGEWFENLRRRISSCGRYRLGIFRTSKRRGAACALNGARR